MTDLSAEHAAYLSEAGVDPEVAAELGVFTALTPEDVPEELGGFRNVPAIVFPYTSADGRIEYQIKPDNPTQDARGRDRKYLWRKGMVPVLWRVKASPGASTVLVVEGTKQCLAAATYAPEGVEVYGIGGCRMWSKDGAPIDDLEVVDGKKVVVILDADAATNREVYDAGNKLALALSAEGAEPVRFARLVGGDDAKAGLDDVLAKRKPERRAAYLARLMAGAKANPADKPPRINRTVQGASEDRPVVVCNADRLGVITGIIEALRAKWDGTELFNHGDALSRLRGHKLEILNRGAFLTLVSETVTCVNVTTQGQEAAWPDPNTVAAILSQADKFTPLDRVARAPFVRPDGSICQTAGYDEATRTVLVPADDLGELDVPDDPSAEEISSARKLLLDEWLGDMPLPSPADKANVLALMLTPAIRGLVPRVPLAVVDGLQMGVGKNLLADCLSVLATGEAANPLPYANADDAEVRKAITSTFRTGAELFVFDEAHDLESASFARALTAVTWTDRILGSSTMVEYPNRVTWVSLGNNVQIRGDMTRRVYRVNLAPTYDSPQDRDNSTFRHPDLVGWTHEHRPELLRAVLLLVRAWFVAGQPPPVGGVSFGSFEGWQRCVGGILETAGVPDFLGNLREWRSETDVISTFWVSHLMWLFEHFEDAVFTTAEVREKALVDPGDYESPPDLEDPSAKGFAKTLGSAYARRAGRSHEGYRILKVGTGHRKVSRWKVVFDPGHNDPQEREGEGPSASLPVPPDPPNGEGGRDGAEVCHSSRRENAFRLRVTHHNPHAYIGEGGSRPPHGPSVPPGVVQDRRVVFDLETAGADELFGYGPGFVRLAGYQVPGDRVRITTKIDGLTKYLQTSGHISGHNVLGFDLVALARYHGLDIHELVDRGAVFDTLLAARQVDPPPARAKGQARKYHDLDSLGERLGFGGKSKMLATLKRRHKGYDKIPVTDPEYREYLGRDVELSAAVEAKLATDDPYVMREHRLAAIAAQLSLNGFRIDLELLASRVAEGDARKAGSLLALHEEFGLPLVNDKGEEAKSPTATKAGKEALIKAFEAAGLANYPKTGTGELATSGDEMTYVMRELGENNTTLVRLASLIKAVVSERTIYHVIADQLVDDRVHPRVSMEQATGRWSITKPGITTVGKRGGKVREREVFLPDPGHVNIALDLAQIDARGVAILSGDKAYAKLFEAGAEDLHTAVAKQVFGNADMRETAKQVSHGWNYGRGPRAISETYGLDPKVVMRFDRAMKERFPRLVAWRAEVEELAKSGAILDNGFGRRMRPDPARAYTQGPSFMGQGFARDVMCEGLLALPRDVLAYLRAFVHDEIVLSVPAGDVEEVVRILEDAFSWPDRWPIPIIGEVSRTKAGAIVTGSCWAEVYAK